MAGQITRGLPTGEIVKNSIARGTGGASNARIYGETTVVLPINATSSAVAGGVSFLNPEVGTVMVTGLRWVMTTSGTGTMTIAVSADGTGSATIIATAATMLAGVYERAPAASATAGGAITAVGKLIGPGGTGTNNSITLSHNEDAGTSVGYVVLSYVRVGTE